MTPDLEHDSAPELLPCPFCGGDATKYHRNEGHGWMNTDWVCCNAEDCGCQTCLHETEAEAIAAWNRRPALRSQSPEPSSSEPVAFTSQKMLDAMREPDTICGTIWPKPGGEVTVPLYAAPTLSPTVSQPGTGEEVEGCTCLEVFGEDPDCPLHSYEALEARIDDLESLIEAQHGAVVVRTAALLYQKDAKIGALTARAETAEARVKELEEALEPFARHLDEMKFDLDNHGNELPDEQTVGWVYVTNGDFRRARTALKGGSNG